MSCRHPESLQVTQQTPRFQFKTGKQGNRGGSTIRNTQNRSRYFGTTPAVTFVTVGCNNSAPRISPGTIETTRKDSNSHRSVKLVDFGRVIRRVGHVSGGKHKSGSKILDIVQMEVCVVKVKLGPSKK